MGHLCNFPVISIETFSIYPVGNRCSLVVGASSELGAFFFIFLVQNDLQVPRKSCSIRVYQLNASLLIMLSPYVFSLRLLFVK